MAVLLDSRQLDRLLSNPSYSPFADRVLSSTCLHPPALFNEPRGKMEADRPRRGKDSRRLDPARQPCVFDIFDDNRVGHRCGPTPAKQQPVHFEVDSADDPPPPEDVRMHISSTYGFGRDSFFASCGGGADPTATTATKTPRKLRYSRPPGTPLARLTERFTIAGGVPRTKHSVPTSNWTSHIANSGTSTSSTPPTSATTATAAASSL